MPREETFPIPTKYIDVTRTTHTSLDVMLEKQIEDCWNVDGEKELSDAWTGFTRFVLLEERSPEGYTWSGEARYVEMYVRCSEKESKTKMGYRETKVRQCQTIKRNVLH